MQKCYNVSINGKVQDVGFRNLNEGIDLLRNIKEDTSVLSSFVAEQRVHNRNLEKILDKLANK